MAFASGSGKYGSGSPSSRTEYPVSTGALSGGGPLVTIFTSASEASFPVSTTNVFGSTMPLLSSIPCSSASLAFVRGGTAKRRACCVAGTVFSGGVSLKLRIAMRSIDSPSSGASTKSGVVFTSASAGAETGS